MHDPRLQKLAQVLVNYSIGVKPGQLVRLNGPAVAAPLMTELYRAVVLAGGHAMVRLNLEETTELLLKHGNDDQLQYVNPVSLYEYGIMDGYIGIWGEDNTRALTRANPARLGLSESARKPLLEKMMSRAAEGALKWCGTQFPCHAAAQDAEMSLSEYADFVFNAGLLHLPDPVAAWKAVSEKQQRLTDYLQGKSDYHVKAANGTDVRMSVAGRTWINCDGHENFPDGEVFTGPVLDSVNGVIQFSFPAVHRGREVQNARLIFRDGKVVDASATKGQDFLIGMLDMDAGSRFLGECAIGTNYQIKEYTRNTLFDEKIGGTVHFAVGAGYPETGNTNTSGLHWDMVVDLRQGGTVSIDGEVFSVDGQFTREGYPR